MYMGLIDIEHSDLQKLLNKNALLEKKLLREKSARKEAELLLEIKSKELYHTANELKITAEELSATLSQKSGDLEHLLKHVIDIICEVDIKGSINFLTGGYEQVLGYTKDELIHKSFYDFIPVPFKNEIFEFYVKAIENKQIETFKEVPIMHKNGNLIWINQTVRLLFQGDEFVKAVAVARDITTTKQIIADREVEHNRLTEIIQNMPLAILLEDENRRIVQTNNMFCELFDIPALPHMLVGSDCFVAVEESKHLFKEPEAFISEIDRIIKERKPVLHQQLKMVNGTSLIRDYVPIFEKDVYRGHMWVYNDISEIERKDYLLAQKELKYTRVLENLKLGILEVDEQEVITKAFPSMAELTGYSIDEMIGQRASELLTDEFCGTDFDKITRDRNQGIMGAYEAKIRCKNGEYRDLLISGAPIMESNDEIRGSIGIHFDISNIKRLEKSLRDARDKAEEAKQFEQNFTARMSHEVRTPLTALQGTLELMAQIKDDTTKYHYLNTARTSANHLRSLVDDILEFSKMKAGKRKAIISRFFLHEFLNEVADGFKLIADEKGLNFIFLIEDIKGLEIQTDRKMLYQVLSNLLSNAIKFTSTGYVGLSVKVRQDSYFEIDVFDTGIGIKESDQKRIFNEYERTKDVEEKFEGAGLGLGIIMGILPELKAEIDLKSVYRKGSCFTVKIPQKTSDWLQNEENILQDANELEKLDRLLIIDDSQQIRHYFKNTLSTYDLYIESAISGYDGINSARKNAFDLIIVDFRMPDINGLEASVKIRENGYEGPIIMASASPPEELQNFDGFEFINAFLSKPFMPIELVKSIEEFYVLQKKNTDSEGSKLKLIPELDLKSIREIYGDNDNYLVDSFQLFLDIYEELFNDLENAISNLDVEKASLLIHKLKPSLTMIGLEEERMKIKDLDIQISNGFPFSKVKPVVKKLKTVVKRQVPLIQKQIQKIKTHV